MTEKRFTAIPETVSYIDNLTGERLCPKHEKDYYAVLNKMNKLSEENEELKHFIQELTTKGTGKIHLANGSIYKIDAILIDFKR